MNFKIVKCGMIMLTEREKTDIINANMDVG
jgi:hypothetical protein